MAKTNKASGTRVRKASKKSRGTDVKMAQANDLARAVVTAEVAEAPKVAVQPVAKEVVVRKGASAVQKGAKYAVLAGRPSKQLVTRIFGKTGYAYSWLKRAEVLGVEATQLCADFVADPEAVKVRWEAATAKAPKATAAAPAAK
jgi:hypothetical protein